MGGKGTPRRSLKMRTPGGSFHKSRVKGKAVGTGKVGWVVTSTCGYSLRPRVWGGQVGGGYSWL